LALAAATGSEKVTLTDVRPAGSTDAIVGTYVSLTNTTSPAERGTMPSSTVLPLTGPVIV